MTAKSLICPSLFQIFKGANPIISCILAIVFSIYNCYYEKVGSEVKNIDDEIPFEIPDTWCWIRLGDLLEIARGGSPRPIKEYLTTAADGVNWIKIGDTEKGGKYINSTKEKIKPTGVSKSRFVHKGDFLLTNSMSFGRPYILNVDGCIHDGWLVFSDTFCVFHKEFLYYVLSSPFAFMQFIGKVSGAVVKNLNSEKVADSIFPLPPFAEQKRIVKEIERFEPLLVEYDRLEQQATKLDDEIYEKLKKSILQYAIQGKLVEQDENDEPASALLERIRAEKKAQLGKKYIESYIYKGDDNCYYEHIGGKDVNITEEIPFDLPTNWCWARLNNIAKNVSAGGDKPEICVKEPTSLCNIPIYSNGEKNNGLYGYTNIPRITEPSITISGRGTIGFSCIRLEPYVPIVRLITVIPTLGIKLEYLKFVFTSLLEEGVGTSIPQLTVPMLLPKLIPVPPLAEQKRIVDKINEIFSKL